MVTLKLPAQQLHSVALRYQPARQPYPALRCRLQNRWWRLGVGRAAPPIAAVRDRRRQRVEAILLLAREPLNSRKLAHYAGLADGTEARTIVRRLNALYDQEQRAFRIEEIGGGFQMLTRPQFGPWLRRLEHVPPEERLSAPALETLAVVAYRQPVVRAEIEAIRGVGCGEILRQLMDRDLVRIGGRSDELGRPYLYTTTRRFLQLFGLQNLEQLPRPERLSHEPGARIPAADSSRTVGTTGDQQQEEQSAVNTTASLQSKADDLVAEEPSSSRTDVSSAVSVLPTVVGQFDDDDLDDDYDDDLEDDFDDDDDYEFDDDVDEDDDLEGDWQEVDDDDDYDEFEDEDYEDDDLDEDEELEGDWEVVEDDEFEDEEYDEDEDDEWVESFGEEDDEDEDYEFYDDDDEDDI